MAAPDLINLSGLMDDAKCFAFVRQHRWPDGVRCPACDSGAVVRDGCDDTQPCRQRYRCKGSSGNIRIGYHAIGLFLDFRCLRSLLPRLDD